MCNTSDRTRCEAAVRRSTVASRLVAVVQFGIVTDGSRYMAIGGELELEYTVLGASWARLREHCGLELAGNGVGQGTDGRATQR